MPKIDVVPVMTKAPGKCVCCHTTPTENGRPKKAIDLNVDVDWGDNAYLCDECVEVICDLWGRVTVEEFEKAKKELEDLTVSHRKLQRRYSKLRDRAKRIVSGKKAESKLKRSAA